MVPATNKADVIIHTDSQISNDHILHPIQEEPSSWNLTRGPNTNDGLVRSNSDLGSLRCDVDLAGDLDDVFPRGGGVRVEICLVVDRHDRSAFSSCRASI